MNLAKKVSRFISLDKQTKLSFIEAFFYLAWARFLVYMPFTKVAPYLGVKMCETSLKFNRAQVAQIQNVHNAIKVISCHTLWKSTCLVRAIAAMKMLQRRKIESTLYLGTAKDECAQLIAHAWLRSGPFYITGAEEMGKFIVVGKIAAKTSGFNSPEVGKNSGMRLDVNSLPREVRLLLLLIQKGTEDTLLDNIILDINWDLFLQMARHHRVYPVIYLKLKNNYQKMVPYNILEALRKDYYINTIRMLHLSREMEQICKTFSNNDLRLLVLKGPVLAADLYGQISCRTSVDLDILLPINGLDKANELLTEMGYVKEEFFSTTLDDWKWRHHHLDYFHPQKSVKLEVHWRLNPGPGREPSFNELWEKKRKSTLTNFPVYHLGLEDLFLFLVSHGARHGWSRLQWLADIDRLVNQEFDFSKLYRLLKKYHSLHLGGQALVLTSELLNTSIPEFMSSKMTEKRARQLAQEALFYIRQMVNLHSKPLPEEVAEYHKRHLFALMSRQQKILFIMSFFYPYPMDVEALPLPKYLHFLYLPLRPVIWAWRKTRMDEN